MTASDTDLDTVMSREKAATCYRQDAVQASVRVQVERLACPIHWNEDVGLRRRRASSRACGSGRRGAPWVDASMWVRRWRDGLAWI